MLITKRDGRAVDYDGEKIVVAIMKAGAVLTIAQQVEMIISSDLASIAATNEDDALAVATVEQIQDAVECELMRSDPTSAKRYILYREERARARALRLR